MTDPGKNSQPNTPSNQDSGAQIGGNVTTHGGKFVGRDQTIHGDEVRGDKIVIHNTFASAPSPAQPTSSPTPTWRKAITLNTIFIGIVTFLAAIFTNIATGVLPESWKPYLWLAWPLAVLATGLSIWLTLRQANLAEEGSPVALTNAQRYRQMMIRRVRSDWVDGVLRKSLYQEALLSLGFEERPDAIERPFDTLVQRPNQPTQPLPPESRLYDLFVEMNRSLLILGAPGAGKTTLLLDLARELLDQAEQDESQQIPVVFNLSSWAVKRASLDEWLVEELRSRYALSKQLAQEWVNQQQLLLLLDGLDEVAAAVREQCVTAINQFQQQQPLTGVVVCSRVGDYESLRQKLRMQGALLIQPLSRQQVDNHLKQLGKSMTGVRAALKDDESLYELLDVPLWLSIVILTHQERSARTLRTIAPLTERRTEILANYVEAMFQRRGAKQPYTPMKTKTWLAWLAQQMHQRQQSTFLIERLQPNWLQKNISTGFISFQ